MKLYMVTAWAVENKARCLFCLGAAVRPSQAGAVAVPGHPSRQGTPVAGQGYGGGHPGLDKRFPFWKAELGTSKGH